MLSPTDEAYDSARGDETVGEWEIRPGGMLVQKRNPRTDVGSLPDTKIRIEVKYGSSYHQIHVCPQASFGELKKVLSEKTGLHPDDQKILYKKKEKSSNMFLDIERVKDRSKLVLVEDMLSRERRCLEMLKISNTQRAHRSLSEISSQVDKFAQQVEELEKMGCDNGGIRTGEEEIENITGNLLSQLVKLDELIVSGDLKLQKMKLERRAQRSIELLDKLKINNSRNRECKENVMHINEEVKGLKPILKQKEETIEEENKNKKKKKKNKKSVSFMLSSSKWETFE